MNAKKGYDLQTNIWLIAWELALLGLALSLVLLMVLTLQSEYNEFTFNFWRSILDKCYMTVITVPMIKFGLSD